MLATVTSGGGPQLGLTVWLTYAELEYRGHRCLWRARCRIGVQRESVRRDQIAVVARRENSWARKMF